MLYQSTFRARRRNRWETVLFWGVFALIIVAYIGSVILFANTVIPRPYPTPYTNWFWGMVHGIMVIPSFVISLFSDHVAIYQSPNNNWLYDFFFLVGAGAFARGASRH